MTMASEFRALDEVELLEFFGVEPVARTVEDGYWCYEVADERGVTLRFSFNLHERSIQTALSLGGSPIATVSHEGADQMAVREGKLRCEFSTKGEKTTLTVETGGSLSVTWSTLRTE
jgi:hypothetical protein